MTAATAFTTTAPAEEPVEAAVTQLVERVRTSTGRQPLDEHRWSLLGTDRDQRLVVADDDAPLGFALISPSGDGWDIDLVIDPDRRHETDAVTELTNETVAEVARRGGGPTHMWVHEATDTDAAAATLAGLDERRDVHQLRVSFPLAATAEPIETRPFEVDRDEAAWLEVNALAFAEHPDQGRWTLADLRARQSEAWFDSEDFLLHEIDEGDGPRLAGFNWTKVHEARSDSSDALGEIYVIGVHPAFSGRGIGRRLCVAGLDHLAARTSTGMLYVDADNEPAMGLYLDLGFIIDHTNTAFSGHIGP